MRGPDPSKLFLPNKGVNPRRLWPRLPTRANLAFILLELLKCLYFRNKWYVALFAAIAVSYFVCAPFLVLGRVLVAPLAVWRAWYERTYSTHLDWLVYRTGWPITSAVLFVAFMEPMGRVIRFIIRATNPRGKRTRRELVSLFGELLKGLVFSNLVGLPLVYYRQLMVWLAVIEAVTREGALTAEGLCYEFVLRSCVL